MEEATQQYSPSSSLPSHCVSMSVVLATSSARAAVAASSARASRAQGAHWRRGIIVMAVAAVMETGMVVGRPAGEGLSD